MTAERQYSVTIAPKRGKPKDITITRAEFDRISSILLREGSGRITIFERMDGGVRTYFVAPSEILYLDDREADGWERTP